MSKRELIDPLRITYFNDRQRQMMRLLETRETVIVGGAYIGDVLSLQAQGIITSQRTPDHKLEIRKAVRDERT